MEISKQHFDILDKHIEYIKQARYVHTCTGIDMQVKKELHDVYTELGYRPTNICCASCVISFMSMLGCIYEENQKRFAIAENKVKTRKKKNG